MSGHGGELGSSAPPIHVVSARAQDIAGAAGRSLDRHVVAGLTELDRVLGRLAEHPPSAACLDLSGHSTRAGRLLRLGADVIDMLEPATQAYFHRLAHAGMLRRLNVRAVRLLGCETAVSPGGQRTLRMLARTLGLPVFGTLTTIYKSHYDEQGFASAFDGLLIEASRLPVPGPFTPRTVARRA